MLSTIRKFFIVSFFLGLMFFNFDKTASASSIGMLPISEDNVLTDNDSSTKKIFYNKIESHVVYKGEPLAPIKYVALSSYQRYSIVDMLRVEYYVDGVLLRSVPVFDNSYFYASMNGFYLYRVGSTLEGVDEIRIALTKTGHGPFEIFELDVLSDLPDNVAPASISNVSHVFNDDNSVTYQYDLPADGDFSHLEIYQDNQLLKDDYKLNSIKISDLTPEMSYKFKFVSVDTSGNKSEPFISSVTAPSGPDLIAPLEVSEIKKVVSGTSIQFSYKLPIDDDFSHLQVWRNNVMIADNLKINTFNDNDLDYDTTYNYVFKSVDFSGNVSNGSFLTVMTMPEIDETAPLSPVGVDVVNGNASLFLSWSASPESDVVGYNVYVDGVKRNGSPVAGNSFRMTNLVNGQEYSLQVSAVDTSGNESELTQTFVGIPDSAMLPVFKVDTDLSAVAKSTENWFSQLWLVTAFSASIPIAFFVGGRVKALFFA